MKKGVNQNSLFLVIKTIKIISDMKKGVNQNIINFNPFNFTIISDMKKGVNQNNKVSFISFIGLYQI